MRVRVRVRVRVLVALIALLALTLPATPFAAAAPAASPPTSVIPVTSTDLDVLGQGTGPLPGDEALLKESLRNGLSGEKLYFVLPDRFANGDTRNDTAGLAAEQGRLEHGFDPTDKGFYHGGDVAGLRARLDYLDGLGVTALWLTPMFRNRWVQGDGDEASAGYHGYWTLDFTSLDPHFGTTADMRALIRDAHRRGMKVFFDIITNHTADVVDYDEGVYRYRSKAAFPYVDADGDEFDDADHAGADDFPALTTGSFPYTPVVPKDLRTAKKPAWLNDVRYYHNRGDSTFAGESSTYGDFVGLDDLFTEHPRVVDGMTDIFTAWIDRLQIDGYRIDTVKHVNDEFWQAFAPAIEKYAADRGRELFAFGEVFEGSAELTSRYTTEQGLEAVLDFPFQGAAQRFAAGGPADDLRTFFATDDLYTDADSNAYALPTFLGNHDMGRLAWLLRGSDHQLERVRLAHSLMYLVRGNPVVYYGDEQGFVGDGGDKDARQDMFPSQVASYNDDDLLGTDATTADDSFDPAHPLYRHIASLAQLTEQHPALRGGLQQDRLAAPGAGVYAFSRTLWSDGVEYVVAVNNATTEQTADVPTYSAGLRFTGLWPAGTPDRDTADDSTLRVTVPSLSAVVYRASAPVADPAAAPGVTLAGPVAGAEVDPGRTAVTASVAGTAPHQVTFAARVAGTDAWTVLGTDDNRPFQVHADLVDRFGADKVVEVRAVAQDRAGAHNGDTVTVTTGDVVEPLPPPGGQADHLVVHYQRADDAYDDWGLHAFGDVAQPTQWAHPVPFSGGDSYGAFAWVRLAAGASSVGLVVHSGDTKDPAGAPDRLVDPRVTPEVWLKEGDLQVYDSLAAARGFARIHYHRPDGQYDGWGLHVWGDALAEGEATTWEAPRPPTGTDVDGVYFDVPVDDPDAVLGFIVHKGDAKDPGPDESLVPSATGEVWKVSGDVTIHPTRAAARNLAAIHYHRPDGDYGDATSADFADFWGLHVWDGAAEPTEWAAPLKPTRTDRFGVVWEVPLADGATGLNLIIHRGDTKDPAADQRLDLATYGNEVSYVSGQAGTDNQIRWLLPSVLRGSAADLTKATAHWIDRDTVLWDVDASETRAYSLRHSPTGGITAGASGVSGGTVVRLDWDPDGMTDEVRAAWPHLGGHQVFHVRAADRGRVRDALRGQVAAVEVDGDGVLVTATGVQIPGVLDDLYADRATRARLGPTLSGSSATVRVWAPTAQTVAVRTYTRADQAIDAPTSTVPLRRDGASGVWSAQLRNARDGFYLYEVTVWAPSTQRVETNLVTDPYAVALSADSTKSQLVDLADPRTKPAGWDRLRKPALSQPVDTTVYELHVRDFSVSDATVPEAERGTYLAFTRRGSDGMRHLRSLAGAGMNHLHLLPAFDFATVPERRADQQQPPCDLPALTAAPGGRASAAQQECLHQVRDSDGFNWGYDPYHYGVPEGSYATDPDGWQRTKEFRQMVQAVNGAGLRVVMDVVYNHTAAAGQQPRSVLDRIVPGYYHRLLADGSLATSTCCANTATEHRMMATLMIDTLVRWARDYKVDGFRFDLMGHHSKQNMLDVRAALDQLTERRDGVDGRSVYLYGEGWNFGEVADDARFVQATQHNMAGTGIGTFSDRLRDAVRGGGPFDDNPRVQGFASGLYTDPNGDPVNGTPEQQRARLLHYQDQIKVGLAGNLRDFPFVDRTGALVTGADVDYNGSPAGYAAAPSETVTYVDAHDNETLYDSAAMKLPTGTSRADRVRMNTVALATTALSQGVSFWHAGADILRSKSLDRNSFNSGDWFNRVDWSLTDSAFGSGLPPQDDNAGKRAFHEPLLADPALDPDGTQMRAARDRAAELLRIRFSSPLFRLGSADRIKERVAFPIGGPDQTPGVVVMTIDDTTGTDLDRRWEGVVVLINASPEQTAQRVPGAAGARYRLHPVQAGGGDPVVKESTFDSAGGEFTVPARTVAVFVRG